MATETMKANASYGPVVAGELYKVQERGYDWFRLTSGYYVPEWVFEDEKRRFRRK